MDSQFIETKLRLHFAVIKFSVDNMLKIYTLREKIRDDVEFNFYNARKVEFDLSNFHPKGLGILGKYFLPELLKDDVERIIIIDVGDVLVLRDLTEMYNWDMEDKIFCGSPDMGINRYSLITRKPFEMYINTGHYLVNVRKAKANKTQTDLWLRTSFRYVHIRLFEYAFPWRWKIKSLQWRLFRK
jgi:lipopolysaccharide biosynthesis glycosyltransferase